MDIEVVRTLVGNGSFFIGGELPKTPLDQLEKMAVKLGSSTAIFPSQSRREIAHRKSRAGARSMKTNAAISRMFQNRYGGNGEDVITVERVHRIIELSNFERKMWMLTVESIASSGLTARAERKQEATTWCRQTVERS